LIHNQLIKNGGKLLIKTLLIIFNWCFNIGYYPKIWKISIINPIPKSNKDHTQSNNYRPISLLSCLGKIFEKLLNNRLLYYISNNINQNQAGFQPNHSTIELLLKLTQDIESNLQYNNVTYACFLDIISAYD